MFLNARSVDDEDFLTIRGDLRAIWSSVWVPFLNRGSSFLPRSFPPKVRPSWRYTNRVTPRLDDSLLIILLIVLPLVKLVLLETIFIINRFHIALIHHVFHLCRAHHCSRCWKPRTQLILMLSDTTIRRLLSTLPMCPWIGAWHCPLFLSLNLNQLPTSHVIWMREKKTHFWPIDHFAQGLFKTLIRHLKHA